MNIRLDGKRALVCGSSQGIGKAIAVQFSEMGASVILMARKEELLVKTLQELRITNNQEHTYIHADFNYPEQVLGKLQFLINSKRYIDILVNNSGGPEPGKISNAEVENLYEAFTQHIITSQMITKALIPDMKEKGFGRIINVISIGAKQPIDDLGVSNTIRGAMASWAKTLSRELGNFGITVNNLLPGYTSTLRLNSLFEKRARETGKNIEEIMNEKKKTIPAARFADPKEVGYAAGFLASEYAGYINGINLPVDGGFLNCL
jgi:3-oxoacyl-[acyl-carrier protein] reductase